MTQLFPRMYTIPDIYNHISGIHIIFKFKFCLNAVWKLSSSYIDNHMKSVVRFCSGVLIQIIYQLFIEDPPKTEMDDGFNSNAWSNPLVYRSYYNFRTLGYIDLTCCALILISNALVILVFTRKKKTSPMDVIFIHIAAVETLVSVAYVPRAIHELFRVTSCSIPKHRTYTWEQISIHSYTVSFLFRAIAVWLGLLLAVWRYITVMHPMKARNWCNMKITRILITAGYIFSLLLTIPPYLCTAVEKSEKLLDPDGCFTTNSTIGKNTTIFEYRVIVEHDKFLYTFLFICYAMFQIVPSLVFAVVSGKLIVALTEMKKSDEEMCLNSHHYFRTTIILVVIFILFAMAEIPHGIFALLIAIRGPAFYWDCYFYAMEICNSVIHISQSFNFIIYYSMSNQFRQIFKELFNCKNTSSNEATPKLMAFAHRFVSPSSGVDRSLGIANQSSISPDVN